MTEQQRDSRRIQWIKKRPTVIFLAVCLLVAIPVFTIRFPKMLPLHNEPDAFRIHTYGETAEFLPDSVEYRELYKRLHHVGGHRLTDILTGRDFVMYSMSTCEARKLSDYMEEGIVLEAVYKDTQTVHMKTYDERYRNVYYILEYAQVPVDDKEALVLYDQVDYKKLSRISNIPYPRKAADYIKEQVLPANEP